MLLSEFDPERKAVINPEEHLAPIPGFPEICVSVFSDAIIDEILKNYGGEPLYEMRTCCGNHTVYKVVADGTPVALSLPWVGGPNAITNLEEIIPLGGKYFVFAGSTGVLRRDIAAHCLILPTAAVRDEGTSYHYQPPAEEIELDPACLAACREALDDLGLPYVEGKTWTTDAFYRETPKKVADRKARGCVCVEMECASLAAVAKFRGVDFVQFLWAADNLDAPEWDKRNLSHRGASLADQIFLAAVETGKRMAKNR